MKTLINVVLFVLFGSVVPASAQSEGNVVVENLDVAAILALIGTAWWRLDRKIDGVRTSLDGKIDGARSSLDGKIDGARSSLDGKIDGVRSDSDTAHKSISKNIDGVKDQLMKLNNEIGTANGKLSILESFVKAYIEARSKTEN